MVAPPAARRAYNRAMSDHSLRLFLTAEHPCGYFPDRAAQDLLLDPHDERVPRVYESALAAGFRRSGGQVYRPHCARCRACQPLRLEVAQFRASRSQRRCSAGNADIRSGEARPHSTDEHYALYRRYVASRHRGGGMDRGERFDFDAFVSADWSPTRFLELRLDEQLVAVAVTAVLVDGLSAVYTFYEPTLVDRGLGTLAILRQLDWARATGKRWLYLGFFIEDHPKMHYKRRFGPAQVLRDGEWRPLSLSGNPPHDILVE
jgi:leucyl-tRNA---protein transferase